MSTGTFNLWQQTFTLSIMANGAAGIFKTVQGQTPVPEELQQVLQKSIVERLGNQQLQGLLGSGWTIALGPYVSAEVGVESNALWVAQNSETNTYVVAIAATNFVSIVDWLKEDANIKTEIPWPYGGIVPSGATISAGTRLGVNSLLAMPGPGQTGPSLLSYLQSVQSSSATLIFTGHSLGGALSPTLATALFANPDNNLSTSSWKNVFVYPTAGPTPGNQAFKQLFSQMFPQQSSGTSPWQVWNSLVWNSLDIVPHAWNIATLNQIQDLYSPQLYPDGATHEILGAALNQAQGTDYVQLPSNGALPGTFAQLPSSDAMFMDEALYQHITAYFQLLQVQALLALTDTSTGKPLFNAPFQNAPSPAVAA